MASNENVDSVTMENGDNIDERKQLVGEKLKKRDYERLADIEKKKEEKSTVVSAEENANFFQDSFTKEKNNLETELSLCESLDKNKLSEKFDDLSKMHLKLQRFVTESTMFLPSYVLQKSQETLTKLQEQIQEKRDQLLPKKKFAFKSKKKGTGQEKIEQPKEIVHTDEDKVDLADLKLTDRKNETLTMNTEINSKDVALARLESCTVKLFGAPSAIHINKLENCTIYSGPVSGSIFIRGCRNCVFVVPCQQLRIHTTKDTKFYIHVTSRAIIEDCQQVSFGPYNWTYPELDDHYKVSGLDRKRNTWNDIDDFNWLAADKRSPNWNLIPDNEQVKSWD